MASTTVAKTDLSDYKQDISSLRSLDPVAFAQGLANCPDREFVHKTVQACTDGVRIGYRGPRTPRVCKNWPSTRKLASAVKASIKKDLCLGRKLGPFPSPPSQNFIGSPMGAFQKRSSSKVRVIHDLSWPPGESVNDFISSEDYAVEYMSVDDVVKSVKRYGPETLLAKLDLADAFHHVLVHPDDWELLGSSYDEQDIDGNIHTQYYVSAVLPFGLRSSPKLFTDIAHAMKLIMIYRGTTDVDHYLDDYITLGPPETEICENNLNVMLEVCQDVGFAVNPNKVVLPCTVLEFLGIIIDTHKMELRISQDRLEAVVTELKKWKNQTKAQKRGILSLIGKLSFVSRVVRSGRTFLRRMIDLSKKAKYLHHKIRLTKAFQADIDWWLEYLPKWNGVSAFYDDNWVSNVDIDLFTDASDKAVAGYYNGAWFMLPATTSHSINWRELYAIVVAAATFGMQWQGKRILFHCDNMCIVQVLCSGTCKSKEIMCLVRKLFFIAAKYEFECSATYINTKVNTIADALSRCNWELFKKLAPNAQAAMTEPVLLGGGLDM